VSTPEISFRLEAAAFRPEARRARRRAAALAAAAGAVVVAFWAGLLRGRGAGPGTLVLPLVLLAALAGLSHLARMRRARARWEGFRVALGQDGIRREVPGSPTLRIGRAEVTAVEEDPRGISVRAAGRALLVPRQLQGYERFREALAAWRAPPQG
jgi:hypothetical protein